MHTRPQPQPPSHHLGPISRASFSKKDNHTTATSSPLPLESLSNAIMAGNLAATRAPPTSAQPPPLPAPRRHGHGLLHPDAKHHHHHRHTTTGSGNNSTSHSRSPQRQAGTGTGTEPPPTTLLTTLRQPPKHPSDDEDAGSHHHHHKRRHKVSLQSKKKHAHHEGARKRWREEVSARERKRYEAVWASNRGLFAGLVAHPSSSPPTYSPGKSTASTQDTTRSQDGSSSRSGDDLVLNVVVRDIWARSRLPFDELAEVWDLVYHGQRGGLNREEFVVGMWLIDQRLRGRKIPARVSDSVWESARGMRVNAPKVGKR